ncbi:aspartic peptidase domain-containing protein [Chytriomyces cf. hyalinus JEL632]|nr:aspartic peptidase domain-containing protein [Chytriomyces cf. hyalinus JEL632]
MKTCSLVACLTQLTLASTTVRLLLEEPKSETPLSFRVQNTHTRYADLLHEAEIIDASDSASKDARTALENQGDFGYFVSVDLGTPAQTLKLHVDTGSAATWTSSKECIRSKRCNELNGFDPSASLTFVNETQPSTIIYGVGKLKGYRSKELINWGSFSVSNFTFVLADYEDQALFDQQAKMNDGLVGLTYQNGMKADTTGTNPDYYPSLILHLFSNNLIERPFFSLWLNGSTDGTTITSGGEILLGGINERYKTGDLKNYPVATISGSYYWSLEIATVRVMKKDSLLIQPIPGPLIGASQKSFAILDSGTSFLACPSKVFRELVVNLAIQSGLQEGDIVYNTATGLAKVDCVLAQSLSPLGFTFTSASSAAPFTYQLFWEDYVVNDGSNCYLAIQPLDLVGIKDAASVWVLGAVFLRRVYSTYDFNGTIGLAYSSNTNKASSLPQDTLRVASKSEGQNQSGSGIGFSGIGTALCLAAAFFF